MRSFLLLAAFGRLIAGQAKSLVERDCGQVCELDALGQQLTFPGMVVTSSVIATTVSVITYKDIKGSVIVQTSTTTANLPPKPTPTWEVSGVTLTYPTTYVIYTQFSRSFVATQAGGACSTGSASLDLGASTDFASLIFPASEISSTLPPSALVGYLESIPTVFAQLGGTVNSSCDPTAAPTTSSSGQTVTLVTTNTQTSAQTVSVTATVSAAFDSLTGSVFTVTTRPPFANGTTPVISTPTPPFSSTTTSTASITTLSTTTSSSTITTTPSVSSTTVSLSSASSSAETTGLTTIGTDTTISPTVTATITSTTSSTPGVGVTTVTLSGLISTMESSPPGNVSSPTGPTSSIQLANGGNYIAVGSGGWLASILGLAVYWL